MPKYLNTLVVAIKLFLHHFAITRYRAWKPDKSRSIENPERDRSTWTLGKNRRPPGSPKRCSIPTF